MTIARDIIAEAMMQSMFAPHELPLPADLRERYLETADAVLAALLSAPDSVRLELAGMLNPWRAIDEAPKDGTKIFAYCVANGHPYMTVIWWRGDKYKTWGEPGYQWRNSLNDSATGGFAETLPNPGPTHWLPLPAPPSEDKPK